MNVKIKQRNSKQSGMATLLKKNMALFAVGGIGYYSMELIFRGHSHWSMALCGGICLASIFHINKAMHSRSLKARALVGAGVITAVEFICGCIVNLILGWNVWDYSHMPINLYGQICLPFTLLWFVLCLPLCAICDRLCGRKNK